MKQGCWIGDHKSGMDCDDDGGMEGGMIETNRYVGVVFPMSMCVSEFELRLQGM